MTNEQFIDLVIDTIEDYKSDIDLPIDNFIERICDIVYAYENETEF